ncbi:hypothetical protein OG705_29705 [Streptomyces sp. NBC_00838]|uniref:hypothetical protein n=1 Tax=Streptomyces sp. NBC_00838 TaxID=2903680 RepID=UPI003866B0AF|nr:hypothetical protein OG705_29705 [Streptomyces sp. NBC_00838]
MGRAMNGGTRLAWPGIVHLSVLHELVDTGPEHTRPTTVPPIWQLSLLYAWCEGQSLGQFAEEAELTRMEAAELSLLVCVRLNAVNARHAVRRGHETGLLTSPVRHRAIKLEEAPA